MPVPFDFFQKYINPFRIATHLSALAALVFYQFFYHFFTGFHLSVPVYFLCSFILMADILYLFFFFESRHKILFPILFFLDSLFLFGLTYTLGAFSIYPVLLLAVFQMFYIGILLNWFSIVIYSLWLSLLMTLALLFRSELTVTVSTFVHINLFVSAVLIGFLIKGFHFFTENFQSSDGDLNKSNHGKDTIPIHRPEAHLELALRLARKLKPALKAVIQNTTKENLKKLKGFHHFINRFIEFAEPPLSEDNPFNDIENFNECIREFIKKLKNHPERPQNLREQLSLKSRGTIRGQLADLEKMFSYIMINSFQALKTKEGRKQILVNTYDFNRWLVLEVIDNGHGMEEEELKQAFDPLFSRRFNLGGVGGLGLSLTEKIVKAHGGSMELQSTPWQKTLVRVKLPLIPLEQPKEQKKSA